MADLTDWAKHAAHWTCGRCGLHLFSPPAKGSRTPKACQCGAKAWRRSAEPRLTLQALNDVRKGGR